MRGWIGGEPTDIRRQPPPTADTPPVPPASVPAPGATIYVSTRLDWFAVETNARLARDVTVASESWVAPPGVYRRLDLEYLGWLWAMVRPLRHTDPATFAAAGRALVELAHQAVRLGVLTADEYPPAKWPVPVRYEPPVAFGDRWEAMVDPFDDEWLCTSDGVRPATTNERRRR